MDQEKEQKKETEGKEKAQSRLRRWALGTLTPKELAVRVWREANKDDVFGAAAELAYAFLFALFPLLLFLVTLIGYLPIDDLFGKILTSLSGFLPQEALVLIQDNIAAITQQKRGGLLSFGLLATLWAASRGVVSLCSGLNKVYDVEESRPWWKVQLIAIGLTLGVSIFAILAAILMIFGGAIGQALADQIGLGPLFQIGWNVARFLIAGITMTFVLAVLYYFGPDVEQSWHWVTPGSVIAVLSWILTSLAFSYYVGHFGSYNKTYGTIGAVIILLTWMYLTGLMILIGGEINSEIERSLPEGKSPGEKRLAEKHPGNLALQARAKTPMSGRARRWLFSRWSIFGGAAALSATGFFLIRRLFFKSPEA
ncbi:MAG: YihY/virulence factor BrkB family protein [Nitrospirae bacterium]|nr:YihY/virulence factor BrkB family protein [Candidatus Manganitrophaceae bacterium]